VTSKTVIAIVLSLSGNPTNEEARTLDAFAMQESTRAAKGIHVPGDGGKAWGIWQFHKARWKECGGDPKLYGKADAKSQAKIMLKALRKYTRKSKWGNLTVEQKIIVAGRCHNIGHCKKSQKNKHYGYTRSVLKHYKNALFKDKPKDKLSIEHQAYACGGVGFAFGVFLTCAFCSKSPRRAA
jgi:hypothetical protein